MGLFRRGQTWWMRFTYKGKQIRKSTETDDKKLAERIYHKLLGEIAEGKWFERLAGEEKTFREMMEKYMKEYSIPKKASSDRDKRSLLHLLPFMGDYTVTGVSSSLISRYKVMRREEEAAPATINRELALMKHAFNVAIKEWEWIKENPVAKISMEKEDNKRDRWLTDEEEDKLLKVCPEWLKELVVFALNTGMRLGEILSLSWEGVDLFRKTVSVFKSKNKERRTIPVNATVFELLKAKTKVRSIKTNLVFHSDDHSRRDVSNVGKSFKIRIEKVGIENFRFHDLRHTFATRLVQSRKDLYEVQRLLGHKTSVMTQRYAHHNPESLRGAVEILDKVKKEFSTNLAQSPENQIKKETVISG
jgi:integrase